MVAVARGDEKWLRAAIETSGPVIYLAFEEKDDEVKAHFQDLGGSHDEAIPIYIHFGSAPADAFKRLCHEIERIKPVLVVIDPLFKFIHPADGNDYATMSNALQPLLNLARVSGIQLSAVHHLGKGERVDGMPEPVDPVIEVGNKILQEMMADD